ncbi:MAG: UDP-3-O-acyl-N-acetylglucosamine deacetylase [Bauldia litoralis]
MMQRGNGGTRRSGTDAVAFQKTLKESISCSGTGLHSGQRLTLTLRPADPDTGLVFRRTDLPGRGATIQARWDNVVDSRLCTTIGNDDGVTIGTVEHLVAALAGAGVDNVLVEVNGAEVPAMDGSAEPFSFLIECAGTVEQDAPRKAIQILEPVSVGDVAKSATLMPSSGRSFSFEIDFDNSLIGRQHLHVELVNGTFRRELARARTFGFEHEVAAMRSMGLARGGSLENAVVVSDGRILNEDGLRFDDEFVRHKLLDSIGDIYLAGYPIIGHFHGFKSGHALNNTLLRKLFDRPNAWRLVTLDGEMAEPVHAPVQRTPVAANA